MPHIPKDERNEAMFLPRTPGQLNYAICSLLMFYIKNKGLNYTFLNDCLGALSGAKSEFYRKVVVPYEEKKIAENGDAFGEGEEEQDKSKCSYVGYENFEDGKHLVGPSDHCVLCGEYVMPDPLP